MLGHQDGNSAAAIAQADAEYRAYEAAVVEENEAIAAYNDRIPKTVENFLAAVAKEREKRLKYIAARDAAGITNRIG